MNSFVAAHDKVVIVPLGGAVGDATPGDVIQGKTFSTREGKGISGSMVDNGTVTLTPGTVARSIPQGYHDGSGYCEGDLDLVQGNIKSSVSIFGVVGDLNIVDTSEGDATFNDIVKGKIAYVDGIKIIGARWKLWGCTGTNAWDHNECITQCTADITFAWFDVCPEFCSDVLYSPFYSIMVFENCI